MRKIALFGGSFNPPHICHVLTVSYVLSVADVDQVWWVPCYQHAFSKKLLQFKDRLNMCRLASAPFGDQVKVSDVEAQLGGESRTIDTVEFLIKQHPQDKFILVVGSDILLEKHLWKRIDDLEVLVEFLVLGREGIKNPHNHPFNIVLPKISSSEIRENLFSGQSDKCRGKLPANVLDYIQSHNLYSNN